MNRLSSAIKAKEQHYEVVVVGSGYGGAIAASRMARAKRKVCLLERGREYMAGDFPATKGDGLKEIQYNLDAMRVDSPLALIEIHVNEQMNAVVGCGLGGTSLINANVALHPDTRLWTDSRWPAAIQADKAGIEAGYARAIAMLQPSPVPADFGPLPKLEALSESAHTLGMDKSFYRPPVTVTFKDGLNAAGVEQNRCIGCGDCNSGCNHGAKNSTHMNYLPDAVAHGAQIFTGVDVHSVERDDENNTWRIYYQLIDIGREIYCADELFMTADHVILSAGTIGSTAILLRSRQAGRLTVSDQLGKRFTGNGDVLAFGFNTDREINGVGWGKHDHGEIPKVGPTITGIIDHRDTPDVKDGFVIEEGSFAAPIGEAMMGLLSAATPAEGVEEAGPEGEHALRAAERLLAGAADPYRGAMHNTQTYLVMAHDDEAGQIVVENGRPRIEWDDPSKQPIFKTVNDTLEQATQALSGVFIRNPLTTELFKDRLVTVHPLGGCAMADDAQHGVVDHAGRVYSGTTGKEVHPGLYVMDGAVMPMSLGVNPLLTISAFAERNCVQIAASNGWKIDYTAAGTAAAPPTEKIGLRFTETMVGSYTPVAPEGSAEVPMSFTLTVDSSDLEAMLASPEHEATMVGTLRCPALSREPMTIEDGRFNLFVIDETHVDRRNMVYRMTLDSVEGKRFGFVGRKIITRTSPLELWKQTNTLYVQIRDSTTDDAPVLGHATLIITPENFLKQQTTTGVTNAPDMAARIAWTLKFGKFFADVLLIEYGGVFAPLEYFDPKAPARERRPLRAPTPQASYFQTPDGKTLRLTRYQGGNKGPVLLIHGSGVSSRIFSTDLIETNLVEFLCAAQYDVWLIDLRVSIDLPSAPEQTTADAVAEYDIPCAVAKVRELAHADTIQVVAHCLGALAFTMSLLSGLEGVRSVVLSQVSAHPIPALLGRIKAGLHVPQMLEHLGVEDLSVLTEHEKWPKNLLDEALRLYPVEQDDECSNAICHRATFLYGPVYEHTQLNETLHENLQELFGVHDIRLFEHLSLMVRAGHVLRADGADVYLPNLKGMKLPIAFIHGAKNRCYLPKSTLTTFQMLVDAYGPKHYEHHLIDGYGHIDCIFGKNAAVDVYPTIRAHLDNHQPQGPVAFP
ncbi:alpha/beta fold hydrolase [Paraburkholderia elongata]|uniref:Cholesterol oxidase n=1 Tax=Paraburkholderia elongata TaxID=2675747 RepID=A0A972NR97_9BURK|nr:alpha/beta fold hydrolase [Paraburkholderia elongata]NPT58191.1 glucose-methanol-choline oxidoreductase [Paraburkholderia elongata]NPT62121.1 glucose-methanol-choline oxidoreductase [Paraburkholderia elongata]